MWLFPTGVKTSLVVGWHRAWGRLRFKSWSLFYVALDEALGFWESFTVTPGLQ